MKKNMTELLEDLSQNLMFTLTEKEKEVILKEFPNVLKQMELVKNINVEEYEPMHFPFSTTHHSLREDNFFYTIDSELVLKNVTNHKSGYIVINKVIN